MNRSSLEGWLGHLEALHPTVMDLGLERVGQVARALDLGAPAAPVITVAGTNGKGSTVAVLEALLRSIGRRPGCFTSPHFIRFNERIRVDGIEASDRQLVDAFEAIEAARGDTSLTYFELATLAALWVFREAGADILVLEVGLGGRLDAVNIIDPQVSVITRIDLDHQDWLPVPFTGLTMSSPLSRNRGDGMEGCSCREVTSGLSAGRWGPCCRPISSRRCRRPPPWDCSGRRGSWTRRSAACG